jgi:ATP-binding cassette subfamily B (MDR/TAP) protein 1
MTGARQATRIRHKYFHAVLRQEVAFFDASATTGTLLQGLNQDTLAVQNAIGEKVGNFVHNFVTFLVGIAIGKSLHDLP